MSSWKLPFAAASPPVYATRADSEVGESVTDHESSLIPSSRFTRDRTVWSLRISFIS
jgi:hypothetical protein